MFTWGSKYLFGITVAAFLAAVVYGLVTGGGPIGVISLGYKGGVGEHTGYAILITASMVSLLLGIVSVAVRDGDSEEMSALAGSSQALAVRPPTRPSYWGPLAAFGLACIAVGVAVSMAFFILGIAILVVVTLEWLVLAWSDRATGDDDVNAVIRNRVLGPIEVPMLGMLGIAVVVIALSRVMLTVSANAATALAVIAAAFIFVSAIVITKANLPRTIVSAILTFGAVAVLAGGILGAVNGEREIVHHEHGEHGESGEHGEDGGHSEEGEDHSEEGEG